MTERRGSGRSIVFWHMKCQREGCGHPRVRHLPEPKPQCCAIVLQEASFNPDGTASYVNRCECTGFREVNQ